MTPKQNIVHLVCDTAMHILHESYLPQTNLWPRNGFKAGCGIGCKVKDRIYYGVNAYGWDQTPATGRLVFNIWNTGQRREREQAKHLRILMDQSYCNELYIEDEFKSGFITDTYWFKFTYTQKK